MDNQVTQVNGSYFFLERERGLNIEFENEKGKKKKDGKWLSFDPINEWMAPNL